MTTLILIAITVAVSLLAFKNRGWAERLVFWPPAIDRQHQYDRLVTHGFIHADSSHLLFNMITLYFFGRPIEGFMQQVTGSPLTFPLFYLAALVVAILPTYFKHQKDANYHGLGASGAVSAVLFAFILLSPWSLILVMFIPVPAIVYAVCYVGYSIWMDKRGGDGINHSAHLSGAAFGIVFVAAMEPRVLPAFLSNLANPGFF